MQVEVLQWDEWSVEQSTVDLPPPEVYVYCVGKPFPHVLPWENLFPPVYMAAKYYQMWDESMSMWADMEGQDGGAAADAVGAAGAEAALAGGAAAAEGVMGGADAAHDHVATETAAAQEVAAATMPPEQAIPTNVAEASLGPLGLVAAAVAVQPFATTTPFGPEKGTTARQEKVKSFL